VSQKAQETEFDPNDPCLKDQELASAADREWAGLHGYVHGTWRIRRRVGLEGPPQRLQNPIDLACEWVLVVVHGKNVRSRHMYLSAAIARYAAKVFGLRNESER
jgi:hypothetical protein